MNTPPLPSPHQNICPKCGFRFEGNPNFCPNCGATLGTVRGGASTATIIIQIALALVALCSGGFGSCALLLFGLDSRGLSLELVGMVGVPILICVACVWGIFRLARNKRQG